MRTKMEGNSININELSKQIINSRGQLGLPGAFQIQMNKCFQTPAKSNVKPDTTTLD
jgi:hypothetical protein